ncbi:MAG: RyR domain-containing protein [Oscillospiraceae bacterium]|nr:RyR domain-containing protein [Oscillospiraceae bacterium]
MSDNYTVLGHSFIREFYYCKRGANSERISYELPGGAAMLESLLNNRALTDDEKNSLFREYFECDSRKNMKGGQSIVPVRRLGVHKGKTSVSSGGGKYTVVWDNGFEIGSEIESTLDIKNVNNIFWASRKIIPSTEQSKNIKFLMLDADVLRKSGAMISKGSSWERTAMNLMWQLRNNPAIRHLTKIPHILITFAEDGAIYIKPENNDSKPPFSVTLVLNDGSSEGSLCRKTGGHYGNEFTIMAAAAAKQFESVMTGADFLVRPVLDSVKEFMETGYPIDSFVNCEFPVKDAGKYAEDNGFTIPLQADGNTQNPDEWQIANLGDIEEIRKTAVSYILYGDKHLKGKPVLEIGNLKTVDRREIEAFGNIHGMISAYAKNEIQQPLCIAVFGSPGSGKSFGVKEIAKNVLSKDEMETITFNVSQYTDYSELDVSFQKVRDICLKGKLPLVFFDEFDSAGLDGKPLGWLKYFLAPMQDGEFNDVNGTHPIGKCILVFAGGTSNTFQSFQSPKDMDEFKNRKGPDFVSRIKGSVDIAGPNPRREADNGGITDNAYILRRALLLRSLCERDKRLKDAVKSNQGTYVSEDIINAMLLVRSFNHGARSIETILGMSQIDDSEWMPSGLPNGEQIGIHVSAREFTDALLIKVIGNAPEGIMAKKIHELFVSHLDSHDNGGITNVDWEQLPLHFKLSNIRQAREYPDYVAKYGGRIDDTGADGEIMDLGNDEKMVEELAKAEHERWMKEKTEDGWKYGRVKDAKRKTNPCILEWHKLDEYTKEKDRDPIREIPQVLATVGKCVYKMFANVIFDDHIEQLARKIHENYLEKMRAAGDTNHPNVIEWDVLSDEFKESNRAQARGIVDKLRVIGLTFGAGGETLQTVEEFDDTTILLLAQIEHIRWMNEKLANGWVYDPVRDDGKKLHPCLVAYDNLSPDEQQKDIDAVNNIIPLLKSIGLRVYRMI